MKNFKIQYVTDSEGIKKAVMILIEEWKKLEKRFVMKSQLKGAYNEVKEIQKENKAKVSLNDFLNEC